MQPITIHMKKRRRRAWKLLFAGALLLLLAVRVDARLRPLITTSFTYQARLAATRAINDAVLEVLGEDTPDYSAMIRIREDEEGRVTFLETDMAAVNRLKSRVANRVDDCLQAGMQEEISLSLGTLLGGNFLSGQGPSLSFRVMPAGYVKTDFYNAFYAAGINQTLHQIMLLIEVPINAMMPLYTVTAEISTSICVAESVIVGEVPQSFTDISLDSRGLLERSNGMAERQAEKRFISGENYDILSKNPQG